MANTVRMRPAIKKGSQSNTKTSAQPKVNPSSNTKGVATHVLWAAGPVNPEYVFLGTRQMMLRKLNQAVYSVKAVYIIVVPYVPGSLRPTLRCDASIPFQHWKDARPFVILTSEKQRLDRVA